MFEPDIAKVWAIEAENYNRQYNNWVKRYTKKHLYEEGLSEQESKVAGEGENILFSELAAVPDWFEEADHPDDEGVAYLICKECGLWYRESQGCLDCATQDEVFKVRTVYHWALHNMACQLAIVSQSSCWVDMKADEIVDVFVNEALKELQLIGEATRTPDDYEQAVQNVEGQ
jgi:hypothetical protein